MSTKDILFVYISKNINLKFSFCLFLVTFTQKLIVLFTAQYNITMECKPINLKHLCSLIIDKKRINFNRTPTFPRSSNVFNFAILLHNQQQLCKID